MLLIIFQYLYSINLLFYNKSYFTYTNVFNKSVIYKYKYIHIYKLYIYFPTKSK